MNERRKENREKKYSMSFIIYLWYVVKLNTCLTFLFFLLLSILLDRFLCSLPCKLYALQLFCALLRFVPCSVPFITIFFHTPRALGAYENCMCLIRRTARRYFSPRLFILTFIIAVEVK